MSQSIQFPCPVCATTLRVPLEMAACHGPCPHCASEIVAPDPATGTGARAAEIAPPPEEIPLPEETPPSAPAKALPAPPRRAVLILSSLLTGGVALVWGYAWGVRAQPAPVAASRPVAAAAALPDVSPPPAEPSPAPAAPPAPAVETRPIAAMAETALRAFLDASDWSARCAHVLRPAEMRAAMETYAREMPDGPTAYRSIALQQGHLDEQTGFTYYIFLVTTAERPHGIPAAVMETPAGWRVDWRAFVEFRDGLFGKFSHGPPDCSGQFRVAVSAPPAADPPAAPEHPNFEALQLYSPAGGAPELAFIRKDNEDAALILNAVSHQVPFTPVLEVAKRKAADGRTFLEIVRIVAPNWSPRPT